MKKCKQCGRRLEEERFRPYASKSKGIRSSSVGRWTICRDCERFNAAMNYIYSIPEDKRTERQKEDLVAAAKVYRIQASNGLEPKGRYAADVLGIPLSAGRKRPVGAYTSMYINSVIGAEESMQQELLEGLERLLNEDLVDNPDIYLDRLDELADKCRGGNGKIKEDLVDIYNRVVERLENYEDAFWDA